MSPDRGGTASSAARVASSIPPEDVTAMVFGVFLASAAGGSPEQAGRLLDLVADALRLSERGATGRR